MASLQIPKDFDRKLKDNNLKAALPLYGRDDFIGSIAIVEIISHPYMSNKFQILYMNI